MFTKEQVAKTIDHAVLKPDSTDADLVANAKMCIENGVFSMCVKPCDIKAAKELLKNSDVKVSCVLSFPHGADSTPVKAFQAKQAIEDGADEIDMVMNISASKRGRTDHVKRDIDAVLKQIRAKNALLKVIIEIELLSDEEIVRACNIVADVGADFVKTSVGLLRGSKPCEVEKVKLMHDTVASKGLKVKASGAIHTPEKFLAMIEAGASRIGTSKGIEIIKGIQDNASSFDY